MAKAHLAYSAFAIFLHELARKQFKCKNLRDITNTLAVLYGISELKKDSHCLYESGYFKQGSMDLIDEAFKIVLNKIRPQALSLVEIFDIDDKILMSAVGNSYGDIYETHLRWAQKSALND